METSAPSAGRLSLAASPTAVVLTVIIVSFAARLLLAAVMGFSFDESYDVVMSRQPQLGYFDHPPLTMWLIAAVTGVTGGEGPLIVRLPILVMFAGTTWLIYRIGARLFHPWAGAAGAIALNLAPLFGAYFGTIAVTDGAMLLGLAFGTLCLADALFAGDGRVRWGAWIAAGIGIGIALLSKYTAVLVLPGVLLYLLTQPRQRHWLWHPAPYLALAVALFVLSPPIVWNALHDWESFRFQGERAWPDGSVHPVRTIAYLGVMALLLLPGIWFGLVASVVDGFRRGPGDERRWFLSWLAVGPMLFFPLVWLFGSDGTAGYHWVAPGYLLAFPLLGAMVADLSARSPRWKRTIRQSAILSVALVVLVYAGFVGHLATGWMRALVPGWQAYDPVASDQVDWWDLRSLLAERGMLDPERYFLIGDRWEDCAKIGVVLGGRLPIVCLTTNPIHTAFSRDPAVLLGRDGLYITRRPLAGRRRIEANFATIEPPVPFVLTQFGFPLVRVDVVVGRNLRIPIDH